MLHDRKMSTHQSTRIYNEIPETISESWQLRAAYDIYCEGPSLRYDSKLTRLISSRVDTDILLSHIQ